MNECEKLRNDLKAYVDGQLTPVTRIAVRLHLNQCAACRKEIEEMRQFGKRMRSEDALEMPESLRARILTTVANTAPSPASRLPKWRQRPVLLWGTSAVAVLSWFILYPTMNPSRNVEEALHPSPGSPGSQYTQDYDEHFASTYGGYNKQHFRQEVPTRQIVSLANPDTTHATGSDAGQTYQARHAVPSIGGKPVRQTQDAAGAVSFQLYSPQAEAANSTPIRSDRRYTPPTNLLVQQVKPASPSVDTLLTAGEDVPSERVVHREASLTVEVGNAEQQSESVERLVKESRGYVAQNQLTTGDDNTRSASLTCKVPVDQFETVLNRLAHLGLLKAKSLTGEDITEKVSDEQETGHVLRADIAITEEKLKERRSRTQTLRDEETLRQLRIRAAQTQARLKMLNRLGTLAEITIELTEKSPNATPAPPKPTSPFLQEISGTGQAAAHSFLMALRLPVQLLVWVVVYAPIWILLMIAYRRFTR